MPWNPIRENQKQDWSQGATLEPNKSWEHAWLYVKNAGTALPLLIQIPDGLVVNLFKVSKMYIYIPKCPMYTRWSNSHDPSWKLCKGEEWNQQSAGASVSAPCYRLSPGDWAVWYPNNWRTISGPSFWKWKPPPLSYTPPPIFNKAHSDSVSPDSLGSKRNPSRFKDPTRRGFQPDVPSSPSLVVWVFQVCLRTFLTIWSVSPLGGDQLTAVLIFVLFVSKTYGLRSHDTTREPVIDLWPNVLWYQAHW